MGLPALATIESPRELLTAPAGKYSIDEQLRDLLCLTDDVVLHVSASHLADPYVLGIMERLGRSKLRYTLQMHPMPEIRELYANAAPVRPAIAVAKPVGLIEETSPRQVQVQRLVQDAMTCGASDIHMTIDKTRHTAVVEYPVNGDLDVKDQILAEDGQAIASTIYQTMCDVADPTYYDLQPHDARLKQSFVKASGLYAARIATRPTDEGTLMLMRLLRSSAGGSQEELGYLLQQIQLITRMILRRQGIINFSGPTGSGKSTTLQRVLSDLLELIEYQIRMLTIENPAEYEIGKGRPIQTPNLCDSDDAVAVSQEWPRSNSNTLRLDPDVLMVGEIRDLATAKAAYTAAMTGHQLWTTLHAYDLVAIVERLNDLGIEISLLTDPMLMTGLIYQELVQTLCNSCKLPFVLAKAQQPSDLIERVERYCTPSTDYVCGPGCSDCNGTGVRGRTVVSEVMMPNQGFMKAIREKGKADARAYWVDHMGGITENAHLIRLMYMGCVDPLHAERDICTLDEDEFTLRD
ncbi:ATPase, T2SS/T4P/T4SS family [Pseudomonas aeruginosa]|uniref:ATPase, T2SS/T4P/T4SS family n=1 Tax=Pseudomonas aeruginosa TaxID=287 RepID=UPI001E577561|nr:ATPase, T2SS/T4P/T4SS family [Pseudomonas aeruginosa]MCC9290093.1 Flp pilus assembly complex ATPase component TadA [Pseudomonas aeruginosa]UVN19095.1 type IV B pilus protein [Pseudomonas aeruginosa]